MQSYCRKNWLRADPNQVNQSWSPLGVFLTPLAQLDHLRTRFRHVDHRFGFVERNRVGCQLNLCAVSAELGDGAVVAGFARHGEFEVIHTGQTSSTTGIPDERDSFQGYVAVQ